MFLGNSAQAESVLVLTRSTFYRNNSDKLESGLLKVFVVMSLSDEVTTYQNGSLSIFGRWTGCPLTDHPWSPG